MLVKERFEKGQYDDVPISRKLAQSAIQNSDADTALRVLLLRNEYEDERIEFTNLEVAHYLKPCPDITKRFWELVEHSEKNQIWHNWLEFHHEGHTEQSYKEAEQEGTKLQSPADYVIFTYKYLNWEYDNWDFTKFFQEWFGDVEVRVYQDEVEVYRRELSQESSDERSES